MSAIENSAQVFRTETRAAVWEGGVISEGWECKALDVSNVSGAVVARVGGSLEWGGKCGKCRFGARDVVFFANVSRCSATAVPRSTASRL